MFEEVEMMPMREQKVFEARVVLGVFEALSGQGAFEEKSLFSAGALQKGF
ncbi:hypothetical protein AAH450_18335 [Erwinia sp. P7711]